MTTRQEFNKVIFERTTVAGRRFDLVLLWLVLASVLIVMLESISSLGIPYYRFFFVVEWIFTIIFSVEYALRIWSSSERVKYIFSFSGLIDLLSVLPSYLGLLLAGSHYFVIIRIFRLLRIFRLMKAARFYTESRQLATALKSSSYKIIVFLVSVFSIVVFMGALMYVVEGGGRGFTSIPQSIYWAIVTITTVGYGDMVPGTVAGKLISSIIMITGYAIIAVPTGIITVEMSKTKLAEKECPSCKQMNDAKANYCSNCGNKFDVENK